MTVSYKTDINGDYVLKDNGERIPSISLEEQKRMYREKLLDYHIQGYTAIDSSPGGKACILYKIGRHIDGKINGIKLLRTTINVYGEELRVDMSLNSKTLIKQLHQITGELLEIIEDEVENKLR